MVTFFKDLGERQKSSINPYLYLQQGDFDLFEEEITLPRSLLNTCVRMDSEIPTGLVAINENVRQLACSHKASQ